MASGLIYKENKMSLNLQISRNVISINKDEMRTQYNTEPEKRTIKEIVKEIPYSSLTSSIPFSLKDTNWKSIYTTPTAYDWYHQWLLESESQESDLNTEFDVIVPPKDDWIEVSDILIDDNGDQRIQFKDKQTARNVFEHALNFDFTKANVWLGLLDNPKDEFHGRYFAIDGGGTLCSAELRGIKKLPAKIVRITDRSMLGENFFDLAESVISVNGVDKFKHRLVCNEPLAVLQHNIYLNTDTTPIRNHPNRDLKQLNLTALKKMIDETFTNTNDTSISGDTRDQVKDEDNFPTRHCQNIKDVIEAISSNYSSESPIVPAVFKELTRFYATYGAIISLRQLSQMISDYKNGVVTLRGAEIHQNCSQGPVDFSSQSKLDDSLGLQNMTDFNRSYGVYCFSKLWNNWKIYRDGVKKIQEAFLGICLTDGKSCNFYYKPEKDYKKTIVKIKDQM